MTPQTLNHVGQLLYGDGWTVKLADALDVNERRVRRWKAGESPIPPGIAGDLAKVIRQHIAALAEAERALGN